MAFPIREKPDRDYVTDLPGSLETLRERWHTGVLLAQYVFTAYENGERTHFHKAYLAVRPRCGTARSKKTSLPVWEGSFAVLRFVTDSGCPSPTRKRRQNRPAG